MSTKSASMFIGLVEAMLSMSAEGLPAYTHFAALHDDSIENVQ